MLKSLRPVFVAALALALGTGAQAVGDKGHGSDKDHVLLSPDAIKWGPAPPSLPAGAKAAVLTGDPSKAGPYVIRVKMPDGYKVPPHWHPTDENVTVLQGTLMVGKGDKLTAAASEALPAGSFMRMPKEMRHFAWAKGETILQVHGIGPVEFNYVNAADDPRKK
jgi:quercetin dioxygenase-like cupin family protein